MTKPKSTPPASQPAANDAPADCVKAAAILKGDRSKTISLEYPVEFDGKTYGEITIRRMTGTEVAAWLNDAAAVMPPMFNCPVDVIDALDADDAFTVKEAMNDFLPRKMRAAYE